MTGLDPYADAGTVTIYAGEALTVDFAADASTVGNPHFVRVIDRVDTSTIRGFRPPANLTGPPKPADPNARETVSFELRQDPGGAGMTLVARSDLGFTIHYQAVITFPTPAGTRSMRTSMCPLVSGIGGFETWPYPISKIVLSNFRLIPNNAMSFACQ